MVIEVDSSVEEYSKHEECPSDKDEFGIQVGLLRLVLRLSENALAYALTKGGSQIELNKKAKSGPDDTSSAVLAGVCTYDPLLLYGQVAQTGDQVL